MKEPPSRTPTCRLDGRNCNEAVEVLRRAFHDYPVMQFIVGSDGAGYESGLRRLIELFVGTRFPRGHPVLGLRSPTGELVGVAGLDPPQRLPDNSGTRAIAERTRAALGREAVARLDSFTRGENQMLPPQPHYYLGMLGVLPDRQGSGLGRVLLDAVHEFSRQDPRSHGVALTTELPDNVQLYEHFGYRLTGKMEFETMTSWGLFRPDPEGETR